MTRNVQQLFDLTGKTALVTGGSRGLGLQMAQALGEAGARIMLTSRKAADLEQAVAGVMLSKFRNAGMLRSILAGQRWQYRRTGRVRLESPVRAPRTLASPIGGHEGRKGGKPPVLTRPAGMCAKREACPSADA